MAGIRIVLIEDDWIIAKEITISLQDMGFEPVGTFDNGEDGLRQITKLQPDLVLLDIGLAGQMNGIETARQLKQVADIPFIFLTAQADQATLDDAKLTGPYGYLVKPVSYENLYSTIGITMHHASERRRQAGPFEAPAIPDTLSYEDSVFVRNKKRLEKVRLDAIQYVEAYDIYAMLHTASGKYLLSTNLKTVEERFPQRQFMRVHRSFIVNVQCIDALEEHDLFIGGNTIPIGKTYREAVLRRMNVL